MATTSKRSAGDETGEDGKANKKPKPEECRKCCLCFLTDEDSDENNPLLPYHNCPGCVRGAWDICEECDDTLLSRQCPICRKNYAPRILFRLPQIISAEQIVGQETAPEQSLALALRSDPLLDRKLAVLASLITSSNVAVYIENHLHFYLPVSFLQDGATTGPQSTEFRSLLAVMPMNDDGFDAEGRFLFTNDIWDVLENEMEGDGDDEEGEEQEGEEDEEQENVEGAEVEGEGNETDAVAPAAATAAAAAAEEGGDPPAPWSEAIHASSHALFQAAEVIAAEAADETDGAAAAAPGGGRLMNGVRLTAKDALKSIFLLLLRGGR